MSVISRRIILTEFRRHLCRPSTPRTGERCRVIRASHALSLGGLLGSLGLRKEEEDKSQAEKDEETLINNIKKGKFAAEVRSTKEARL